MERLTEQIYNLTDQWCMAPIVKAIQAMRGISTVTAVTTIAELDDLNRFIINTQKNSRNRTTFGRFLESFATKSD